MKLNEFIIICLIYYLSTTHRMIDCFKLKNPLLENSYLLSIKYFNNSYLGKQENYSKSQIFPIEVRKNFPIMKKNPQNIFFRNTNIGN